MQTELTGGYINKVFRDGESVIKIYDNDSLVGLSGERRLQNEASALQVFGGTIAPRLINISSRRLEQQFIEGESFEIRARRGEQVFADAGQLLGQIHRPFSGNDARLREYYEKRFSSAIKLAQPILQQEKISPAFNPEWTRVGGLGITCLHKDFWLANIIGGASGAKVIDWEFAGVGSPYEDFAIVNLWISREFFGADSFWDGYGQKPHLDTVHAFLGLKCTEFIATTNEKDYAEEDQDGFYHNKIAVLKDIFK